MKKRTMRRLLPLFLLTALLSACATGSKGPGETLAYLTESDPYEPVFVIEHAEKTYNLIGTPMAELRDGHEYIYVDFAIPSVFVQETEFDGDLGHYTNRLYRIHFEKSPFTLIPFNASFGKNVGFFAVVTLDAEGRPVFLTTLQSCGCYHAIIPTSLLDERAYPDDWENEPIAVYGETLPGRLDYPSSDFMTHRPLIRIRAGTHRARDVALIKANQIRDTFTTQALRTRNISELKALPLGSKGDTTSFYFTEGPRRGLVRGARKPMETLLFGAWVGDAYVGHDREYGSKADTGKLFYTTLSRSGKQASDMSNFARFLRHNGWRP